jgi:hypothetical protein
MQVVGGIGYTNVSLIENMIGDLLIQHEYYRELLKDQNLSRMIEAYAKEAAQNDGKVYEDDETWTKGW